MASLADLEERVKKLEAAVAQLTRELPPQRGIEVKTQSRLYPSLPGTEHLPGQTSMAWDATS